MLEGTEIITRDCRKSCFFKALLEELGSLKSFPLSPEKFSKFCLGGLGRGLTGDVGGNL